ncbi:hypothetical protein ACWEJZ_28295 [Streptomyces bacillaris]|uniref:hypothetical protein n=1 Tax=Streptomyces rhizosphaericola TaxID=2564098 RepID=UPI00389529E0
MAPPAPGALCGDSTTESRRSGAGAQRGRSRTHLLVRADYPAYDSIDEVIEESDVIIRGTVVGAQGRELLPEASEGDDPAANPQAGVSPEEAAEVDPVIVTVSTVKVAEVLSGPAGGVEAGDTVEVSQLGGTVDGVTYKEEQTTHLVKGTTEYVLMLADHGPEAPYDLLNPTQALYTVTPGEKVEAVADAGFGNAGSVGQLAAKARTIGSAR